MNQNNQMPRILAVGLLLVGASAGCQRAQTTDFSVLKLADVTGVVTLDGEPLAGAYVVFEETETKSKRTCYATTDSSGYYTVIRGSQASGCLPGRMVVRITSRRANEEDVERQTFNATVPAKYNRRSELFVDVTPNGEHTFDFDLISK